MNDRLRTSLDFLAEHGRKLSERWRLPWPEPVQQAVHRLRLDLSSAELPALVAIIGGASSGKSTVFNNLLDGHLTSRITAWGHATLGPILAAHEARRPIVEGLLAADLLLPGLRRTAIELDDHVTGDPQALAVVFHGVEALRDVLLLDTPDFTSEAAFREGDICLSLLPWFDRLLVVVDHERWFDRQSVSKLRADSVRFGQQRLVLFNRTREGPLREEDHVALQRQAQRLAADAMVVLEFRRGRGFCRFAPGALEGVQVFLRAAKPDRTGALTRQISDAANGALNQHEERVARLGQLRGSLETAAGRVLPQTRECLTALMTAEERRRLEVLWRVFRLDQTRHWLAERARRLQAGLRRVPIIGGAVPRGDPDRDDEGAAHTSRGAIAESYFESVARRQRHEVRRMVHASAFWDEIRRWTGLEPGERSFDWEAATRERVRAAVDALDAALRRWTTKVEVECQGIGPHVHGAIGVAAVALAAVLIALPGPLTALTLVSAKTALGAALGHLLAAGGAGAALGKHIGRLTAVVQEKLIGSPEFHSVEAAADEFRALLDSSGRVAVNEAIEEAESLVLPREDPLTGALEVLRHAREAAP